jgi:hypothetical protein
MARLWDLRVGHWLRRIVPFLLGFCLGRKLEELAGHRRSGYERQSPSRTSVASMSCKTSSNPSVPCPSSRFHLGSEIRSLAGGHSCPRWYLHLPQGTPQPYKQDPRCCRNGPEECPRISLEGTHRSQTSPLGTPAWCLQQAPRSLRSSAWSKPLARCRWTNGSSLRSLRARTDARTSRLSPRNALRRKCCRIQ